MKVFAVDPGMTGALAMVDTLGARVEDLPLMRDQSLAWIDGHDLLRTLLEWRDGQPQPIPLWIERQSARPGQGVSSSFKSGCVLGSIIATAQAACCQIHFVSASKWKQAMGVTEDKNSSLDKARLLFPLIELNRKKDHNQAEALLIAQYGMGRGLS